jgi:hypothetical protein
MSIYGDDQDFDYAAEMRALDALIPVDQSQVLEDGILAFAGSDQLDASPEVTTTSGGASSSATLDLSVETPKAKPKANAVKAAPPRAEGGETSWPAVEPKLYPSNARTTVSQHQNGIYVPSDDDEVVHRQYFGRRPLLVDLMHTDMITSLHLFDQNNDNDVIPTKVMLDSGARVFILISPTIAKALKLTIEEGSAPIKRIGGSSGSL